MNGCSLLGHVRSFRRRKFRILDHVRGVSILTSLGRKQVRSLDHGKGIKAVGENKGTKPSVDANNNTRDDRSITNIIL
jgi:hypothetical protein